ncbi:unnamed protein product [Dibothriocephalus latus]|uniref:Uncharacterized protein n=1 Tax=Dibothriocephalus latus TaxID=60516 RepID=A0A3P7LXC6_DIBLA|nr:unnamed protein product [Dibothriocephalus latus]
MRQEILPRLAEKTRGRNAPAPSTTTEEVKTEQRAPARSPYGSPCNETEPKSGGILSSPDTSVALAVEFWSPDGLGKQNSECRPAKYATTLVSSAQGPKFHVRNQILRTVNLHRQSTLSEVVEECFSGGAIMQSPTVPPPPPPLDGMEASSRPDSTSETEPRIPINGSVLSTDQSIPRQDQILPRTLVTNDSKELARHISSLGVKEGQSFVIIPCLVSALSDAVSVSTRANLN